jgi:hypothetical protein
LRRVKAAFNRGLRGGGEWSRKWGQ